MVRLRRMRQFVAVAVFAAAVLTLAAFTNASNHIPIRLGESGASSAEFCPNGVNGYVAVDPGRGC